MASHFLVYRRIIDSTPAACDTDPDRAAAKARSLGATAVVSRLLTGHCKLCGRGVSRLGGDMVPVTLGDDA